MTNPYSDLPSAPPEYATLQQDPEFLQFDIEEPPLESSSNRPNAREILNKAGGLAKQAGEFAKNITRSFNNALDPVYQLYSIINNKLESYLSKLGNPLIVKRLLYVFFIVTIIYMFTLSGVYPSSLNTVSYGDYFYDSKKVHDFIDDHIQLGRLEDNLEYLSSMPHLAGTSGDLVLFRYVDQVMRDSVLSLDADSSFKAYANYPSNSSFVRLVKGDDVVYDCNLREHVVIDKRENKISDQEFIHELAFNPGSLAGDVRGKIVYANYGFKMDFQKLKDNNIELENKIAFILYGGNYIPEYKKLEIAKSFGIIGVIFISDPSSFYNLDSIQRESVSSIDYGAGNIINPGFGADDNIPDYFDFDKLMNASKAKAALPSIPISWKDFIAIMKNCDGERLKDWDFKINDQQIEIKMGGDDFEIELNNNIIQRPQKEMWNMIGRIKGTEQSGMAIVIGASRDSTCYGTSGNSGTAILLELINVFTQLSYTLNWQPLRSIYFASYSGSVYNLAGSTYFSGNRREDMKRMGFAYIDLNDMIQGTDSIEISANPLLHDVIREALHQVPNPSNNATTISDIWNQNFNELSDTTKNYVPFEFNLGIPSVNIQFKRKDGSKLPKNSCFDSFENFKNLEIDPEMRFHKAMTSLISKIILQLSSKSILPMDINSLVTVINSNLKDLTSYSSKQSQGSFNLDLTRITTALLKLKVLSRVNLGFRTNWLELVASNSGVESSLLSVNRQDWNTRLALMTKVLLDETVEPRDDKDNRKWFRNVLFGTQLNYPEWKDDDGNLTKFQIGSFPKVRDRLEISDWEGAQKEIDLICDMLDYLLGYWNEP